MSRTYGVIDKYRNAATTTKAAPSLAQLETLRDSLTMVWPIDEIVDNIGWDSQRIMDEVATLGKWLIHTNGGIEVEMETASQQAQLNLFQDASLRLGPATHGKGAKVKLDKHGKIKLNKKGKRLSAITGLALPNRKVIIPSGFEPGRGGRDVSRALSAIVVYYPDATTLARYTARTYPPVRQSVLTFSILTTVWKFAEIGRLDEIDQVAPDNSTLMDLVISAYDTLDLAITNSHEGAAALVIMANGASAKGENLDLDAVRKAAVKARLLNEAEVLRLESRIALCQSSGSNTSMVNSLRAFAQGVKAAPRRYHINDIADLNPAQVRRIAEAAGIEVGGTDRATENEIRARLKSMGIDDLDRLVLSGVQAHQMDRLDDFYEAMALRAEGNNSWAAQLSELFS